MYTMANFTSCVHIGRCDFDSNVDDGVYFAIQKWDPHYTTSQFQIQTTRSANSRQVRCLFLAFGILKIRILN